MINSKGSGSGNWNSLFLEATRWMSSVMPKKVERHLFMATLPRSSSNVRARVCERQKGGEHSEGALNLRPNIGSDNSPSDALRG